MQRRFSRSVGLQQKKKRKQSWRGDPLSGVSEDQDRMRVDVLLGMGDQVELGAGPVGGGDAGLHLGKGPGDGLGVQQEEGQRRVGEVEELVSVEVVYAWVLSVGLGECGEAK